MARIRGRDRQRCLVVPVDVGKSTAMALVADHYGEVVVEPFEFPLTEPGFAVLASAIARSEAARSAEVVRVGVESAGHYHRTLVARLRSGGYEVVELNPAAVKESRAQQLLARLKSDARDLGAMAELMVRGAGRQPALRTDALATQAAWVAHRRRASSTWMGSWSSNSVRSVEALPRAAERASSASTMWRRISAPAGSLANGARACLARAR
jgi:hypothetical protein